MVTTAGGAIVADVIPQHRRGEGMGYYVLDCSLFVHATPSGDGVVKGATV